MKNRIAIPTVDVKKYGGKQVAILDGKVISSGRNLEELIRSVRKIAPGRALHEIKIFSVPQTLAVIYHV